MSQVNLGVNYPLDDIFVERVEVPSHDSVNVPLTIFYHKNFKKDGNSPLLLTSYGAYGINIEPDFSVSRLPLLGIFNNIF